MTAATTYHIIHSSGPTSAAEAKVHIANPTVNTFIYSSIPAKILEIKNTAVCQMLKSILELNEIAIDFEPDSNIDCELAAVGKDAKQEEQRLISAHNYDTYITEVIQYSEHVSEITTGTTVGATVPVHVDSTMCHTLIYAYITSSCMNGKYFQTFMLSNLTHLHNI